MNDFRPKSKPLLLALLLICTLVFTCSCATTPPPSRELPPLLTQDELLRPYQKVASIEVKRERYGSPSDLTPVDYDWAYQALRQEAARIGADAVITPEVRVELRSHLWFPISEMKARGIAIKFR
jgi:hypothetical protein